MDIFVLFGLGRYSGLSPLNIQIMTGKLYGKRERAFGRVFALRFWFLGFWSVSLAFMFGHIFPPKVDLPLARHPIAITIQVLAVTRLSAPNVGLASFPSRRAVWEVERSV